MRKYQRGFVQFIPLIAAGISAAGSLIGGERANKAAAANADAQMQFNAEQADINRTFSAEEAAKSRDWQAGQAQVARDYNTEMANSTYQRAVGDMRAAGLNPMLAYSQGGAPSPSSPQPSGSTASGSQASYGSLPAVRNTIGEAIHSAGAIANVQNIEADTQLKKAQAIRETASAGQAEAQKNALIYGIEKTQKEIMNIAEDTNNKQQQHAIMKAQERLVKAQERLVNGQENVAETQAELNKIIKELREQDIRIAKPMEDFAGSTVGESSPAIKLLMDLVRTISISGRGR